MRQDGEHTRSPTSSSVSFQPGSAPAGKSCPVVPSSVGEPSKGVQAFRYTRLERQRPSARAVASASYVRACPETSCQTQGRGTDRNAWLPNAAALALLKITFLPFLGITFSVIRTASSPHTPIDIPVPAVTVSQLLLACLCCHQDRHGRRSGAPSRACVTCSNVF